MEVPESRLYPDRLSVQRDQFMVRIFSVVAVTGVLIFCCAAAGAIDSMFVGIIEFVLPDVIHDLLLDITQLCRLASEARLKALEKLEGVGCDNAELLDCFLGGYWRGLCAHVAV